MVDVVGGLGDLAVGHHQETLVDLVGRLRWWTRDPGFDPSEYVGDNT